MARVHGDVNVILVVHYYTAGSTVRITELTIRRERMGEKRGPKLRCINLSFKHSRTTALTSTIWLISAVLLYSLVAKTRRSNIVPISQASVVSCEEALWRDIVQLCNDNLSQRRAVLRNWTVEHGPFPLEKTLFDPFEATWLCQFEERVGRKFGDGGKFVCGSRKYFTSKPCLVYSVGSDGDFNFEESIRSKFGCEVHVFDPTGDVLSYERTAERIGAHFHPWGLGPARSQILNQVSNSMNDLLPLNEMRSVLGHSARKIDILKVDCEGCEYGSFRPIWDSVMNGNISLGQIQVELHVIDFSLISEFFEAAATAGFEVFHKERNQWGCNGYLCVEFSLVHVDTATEIFESTLCNDR